MKRFLQQAALLSVLVIGIADAQVALPPQGGDASVPSLAPMIKKVSPTVVNIATRGTVRGPRSPLLEDEFFRRFFQLPPDVVPRERPTQSLGSGVVVDEIGRAHV